VGSGPPFEPGDDVMIKHLMPLALALAIGACGGETPAPAAPEGPAAAAEPGAEGAEPTAEAPAEPAAAAPAFDADAVAGHLEALAECRSEYGCPAHDALIAFGPAIGPLAHAFALDTEKPAKARGIAMSALGAVKAEVDAGALYAAIRVAKDRDLFSGLESIIRATTPDDEALIASLRADLLSGDRAVDALAIRRMLGHLPGQGAWALAELEGGPPAKQSLALANLVSELSTPEDAARLASVLPTLTHPMAKHRIAATAIAHGDKAHFPVLLDGLRSNDVHDRSDAANMLARVVKELPAELKAEAIELLKAGKARDRGGVTARGYDNCLKVLEGG